MSLNKKVVLIIMDGWGHGPETAGNAIFQAKTPFVDSLYNYPNTELQTSGEDVGLPDGQMGKFRSRTLEYWSRPNRLPRSS